MIERVLLVAWKGSTATSWVETLKSGGYTVLLEDTTGERAWRTAKERGIDVVIIDGQKKPSHGRQTGHALRDTAKTRNIPIIWTNLEDEDNASVQSEVKPDVALKAPTDAASALSALQSLHAQRAIDGETSDEVDELPEPAPAPVVVESVSVSIAVSAEPETTTTIAESVETVEVTASTETITVVDHIETVTEIAPAVAEAPAPTVTKKKAVPAKKPVAKKAVAKKPVAKSKPVKNATAAKKVTAKKAPAKKPAKKASAKKK